MGKVIRGAWEKAAQPKICMGKHENLNYGAVYRIQSSARPCQAHFVGVENQRLGNNDK